MEPTEANTEASVQVMMDVIQKTKKIYPLTDKLLMSLGQTYEKLSSEDRVLFVDSIIEAFEDIVRQLSVLKDLPPEERLREMLEAVDLTISEHRHPGIMCKRGCSGCCYQKVAISELEAEILSKKVSAQDIPILRKQAEAVSNLDSDYNKLLTREEARCVFLKNGECSIYNDRPMMCRTYHVVSEPALCDVYDNPNSRVAVPHSQMVELVVSAVFYESGKEGNMASLILENLKKVGFPE